MCSKDKFNTTPKITQLEIRCFIDNTKNYFEIIENTIKDNNPDNKNICSITYNHLGAYNHSNNSTKEIS